MDSLAEPTALLEYDLWAWHDHGTPVWMRTQARELHGADPGRWLETYAYSDGRGETVMAKAKAKAKAKAQPGVEVYDEILPGPVERWVGNGRTIRNNKGLPVRQYEPFFSTTSGFESEAEVVEHGVTPVLHYDPLGRLIQTELPNGTEARVEFSPWEQRSYDPNDSVLGSAWHAERVGLPVGDPERRAAALTEAHADTPTITHLDHLGRAFLAIEHNRDSLGADLFYETRAQLDVQGNVLRITDANGTIAEQRTHGMLAQVLHTTSLEVGDRWALSDVLGAPPYATASRDFSVSHRYDQARRPTHTFVTRPDSTTFTATRVVYGEAAPTPAANNLRGQAHRIYDGAGLQEHDAFDVDGNLVRQSRRLAAAYDISPDWAALDDLDDLAAMDLAAAGMLEAEVFTTEASFDAMGRPVTQTTPDASVLHLGYGDAGHLETVAANVRGDVTPTGFVADLRYNARGQRTLVVYGNGTQTSYAYDPLTFRLTQLQSERLSDGHLHQDLRYTFDPTGNITEIRDLAQPIVFTSNAAVTADQRFEYDALYRLVHAEGREHGSQGQPTADDFVSRASPDDPTGLRPYAEQYLYDAVGNILQLQHTATSGNWTRHYSYEPATSGNRLLANSALGDAPGVYSHAYAHDAHGSMTAMPHLAAIGWDWTDRMQSADLGGGGTVHFTYDATGQRVRKLRVNQAGTSTWERIYLGGFELYRERVGTELRLERQTLHIGDDAGRVCLVETKTIDNALPIATPANISRYQYANHLGTVGLELDETGQLISYEEFHPYGTTAYRAADSTLDVSPSRYRYTGKERDEETGLGYHGTRYYASWLARWTAADPIGLGDGPNRFANVSGNPVRLSDPSGTHGVSIGEAALAAQVDLTYAGDVQESLREARAAGASAEEIAIYEGLLGGVQYAPEDVLPQNNLLAFPQNRSPQESFARAAAETQRGQAVVDDLESSIDRSRGDALRWMITGTAAVLAVPFAIELGAGFIAYGGLKGSGTAAAYLAVGDVAAAGTTYIAGNTALAYGATLIEATAEAAAVSDGLPPTSAPARVAGMADDAAAAAKGGGNALTASPSSLRRTHPIGGKASSRDVLRMAEEIKKSGYNGPPIDVVVKDGEMFVVDGHHRLKAAKMAGLDNVPIHVVDDIAAHPSSWKTVDEVVQDAAAVGPDNLRNKGRRF